MQKNIYLKLFLATIVLAAGSLASAPVKAQGCVAVRNMSTPCSMAFDSMNHNKYWQFSLNYRYFRSYKHFRGSHEETERVEQGTEVINKDNSVILGASYTLNNRWNFSVVVPYVWIDRSSLYEHKGNNSGERYHTQSNGLGDIRVSAYYALMPHSHKGNLTAGLGIKIPTGNYEEKDWFHKQDGLRYLPVDQSIQPGDGGWGFTTEVDFNYLLTNRVYGYFTGFYLFNPRNTNGVERSANLSDGIPLSNEFSVTDQFLFRAGSRYVIKNLQIGAGIRYEGIPVEDVFGESDGFRRPGYIVSVEPSVIYSVNMKHTFGLNLPIALYRNRTQSVVDKQRTEITGEYRHGDAAFSDWLVSVYYLFTL